MEQILIVFLAALLGAGSRTLVAWLMKIAEGEAPVFDAKFIATAILAVITVLFIAMGVVITTSLPAGTANSTLLFMTVAFGTYTINDLENRALTTSIAVKKPSA